MAARKLNAIKKCRLNWKNVHSHINPAIFKFDTTEQVKKLDGVVEQARAQQGLELGLSINKRNFNIYVSGASGTGKSSLLKRMVREASKSMPTPPDWCMVNNFKYPETPSVFCLPPGQGLKFRAAMDYFVTDMKKDLPRAFHSQDHQETLQDILNKGLAIENEAFEKLEEVASDNDFQIKQTKEGLVTMPIVDGEPINNKDYAKLNEEQRKKIDENRRAIEPAIAAFFEKNKEAEQTVHSKVQDANKKMCSRTMALLMEGLKKTYKKFEPVLAHLEAMRQSVLENIPRFLAEDSDDDATRLFLESAITEYKVNLLVDNSETKGAPIIFENTPTYHNLVGRIEKKVENGIYSTDFTMIKAGALLRANGGFLVLHTQELISYPFAWEALKTVLRQRVLEIAEMGEAYQFLPTTNIRPDPIPMSCKVILVGSNFLYQLLYEADEEFGKAFQIKAEFDSEVAVSDDMLQEYARFIATTSERDGLLPVSSAGVADVIEYSMRIADASDKLTLQFNRILNLLIEADHLARKEGVDLIENTHIIKARQQRKLRASLAWDKGVEMVLNRTVIIDSDGTAPGVINGLAVYRIADQDFGMPLRITARSYRGTSGIINVERESRLSGNTFNKAVMIISGLLGDMFSKKRKPGVTVNLTVEQSYGRIDGDSASCAEFCAVLSSMAGIPLRQDTAVTGSLNQTGEVQAVGGVNEKIEGFFRICNERGLTGKQGVIIPEANRRNLVLDPEVEQAVKDKTFNVWAVSRIEEVVEITSGIAAGVRNPDGTWEKGSFFEAVDKAMAEWCEKDDNGKKKDSAPKAKKTSSSKKGTGKGREKNKKPKNIKPASK